VRAQDRLVQLATLAGTSIVTGALKIFGIA
jgi:hypothetical protein